MSVLFLLVVFLITATHLSKAGEVLVTDRMSTTTLAVYHSMAATFGQPLPDQGLHGVAVQAIPGDACYKMQPPPHSHTNRTWIAVASRYGCTFEEKVRNAQNASYSAVIIYNVNSDKVISMGGQDDDLIPSVFIGFTAAEEILRKYTFEINPDVRLILTNDDPFDINAYLLPFAIVVGVCFLVMLGIVLFKCIQDHRRRRRHRLPKSALKKLPIHKFKDGDPFETCCICLDDFEEGDKLRILPCDHGYHSKCIDPWLVKNKRICPQCRKRVFESNERGAGLATSAESDSDEATTTTTNERAPLLSNQIVDHPTQTQGGTFSTTRRMPSAFSRIRGNVAESDPEHLARRLEQQSRREEGSGRRRQRRTRRQRRVFDYTPFQQQERENSSSDAEGAVGGEAQRQTRAQIPQTSGGGATHLDVDSPREVSAEVHVHIVNHGEVEGEESPPEIHVYDGANHDSSGHTVEQDEVVIVVPGQAPQHPPTRGETAGRDMGNV